MTAMMRYVLGAAVLIAVSGCMHKSATWLDASSTADRPVIGVARERYGTEPVSHLNLVVVWSCYKTTEPRKTFWRVHGELPPGTPVPTRIAYGVAPSGFETEVAPQRLDTGCYEAIVSGNGVGSSVHFTIGVDRTIHENQSGA